MTEHEYFYEVVHCNPVIKNRRIDMCDNVISALAKTNIRENADIVSSTFPTVEIGCEQIS
jgi:hypothetical protein